MSKIDDDDLEACRLRGEVVEATRCHCIYATDVARARPLDAWLALPLGMRVSETLEMLDRQPASRNDAGWLKNMALLDERYASAVANWKQHQINTGRGRDLH